jgi:hypothetical protein
VTGEEGGGQGGIRLWGDRVGGGCAHLLTLLCVVVVVVGVRRDR